MNQSFSRKKKGFFAILAVVFICVLTAFFLEIFLRFVRPQPLPPRGLYVEDEETIFSLAPNFEARIESFGLSYPVRTNASGFRDDPWTGENEDSTILFLGDSFTFGVGVEAGETFVERAEDLLNREEGGPRVQCINTGVLGYGTYHELQTLRKTIDVLRPEVVVLAFCLANDFGDNIDIRSRRVVDGYLVSGDLAGLPGLWGRIRRFFSYHSHLYRLVLIRTRIALNEYRTWRKSPDTFTPVRAPFNRTYTADSRLFRTTFHLLEEVQELCRQKGAKFMLVMIPLHYQVSETVFRKSMAFFGQDPGLHARDYPNRQLEAFCRQRDIPYLDLLPLFEEQEGPLYFQGWDKHFNREGHLVAGRAIAEAIGKQRDLPVAGRTGD